MRIHLQFDKSRHLLKVADSNKASIDEALELLSVVESEKGSDSESEVAGEQEDEYWYDTSNIELSQSATSPLIPPPIADQDPETWSHSNQFFPEGCVTTPVVLPGPSSTSRSVNTLLCSPFINDFSIS